MAAITLARAYQHSFEARPNITLAIAGGSLTALGDCVAQLSERTLGKQRETGDVQPYDFIRTGRFFFYGLAISPFLGRWNAFLESRFPLYIRPHSAQYSRNLRTLRTRGGQWTEEATILSSEGESAANKGRLSWAALTKRVAADQLIMAPIGLTLFIGSMGILEGRTKDQIKEKYRDLFGEAMLANWKVWPLAQMINFRFMPLPYRVPFSQTCGVFWTLYLSMLNSREDIIQDEHAVAKHQEDDWKRDQAGKIVKGTAQGTQRVI